MTRRTFAFAACCVLLCSAASALAQETSRIEVLGRSPDDPPPARWTLRKPDTQEVVVESKRWEAVDAPLGQYLLVVQPPGQPQIEVPWSSVTIESGRTTTVRINSGIDVRGRDGDPPLNIWQVRVAGDEDESRFFASVSRRWDFTPLPPGSYELIVQPQGYNAPAIRWSVVNVEAGKTAIVAIDSGIDLHGRAADDPTLAHWSLSSADDDRLVARVYDRWGFTPAPPGRYHVALVPEGYNAQEARWSTVTIEPAKVMRVNVDSGVEVVGRDESDTVLEYWWAASREDGSRRASVHKRWGFSPLPPGAYDISLRPQGYNAVDLRWGSVTIEPGKTARVEINSGIEVRGRDQRDETMEYWWISPPGAGDPLGRVHQRWGFTPVPPGEYELFIRPQGYNTADLRWAQVRVEPGATSQIAVDSGIEVRGRSDADQTLEYWWLARAEGGERAANVHQRWGFTPAPPGEYDLVIRPQGYNVTDLTWTRVRIEPSRTASVSIDSGIDVRGRDDDDQTLEYWWTTTPDGSAVQARVHQRWGFTPLTPGDYRLVIRPQGYNTVDLPWSALSIKPGESAQVRIDSGVELLSRTNAQEIEYWRVMRGRGDEVAAQVHQRWGFAPAPRGEYRVVVTEPAALAGEKAVAIASGEVVRVWVEDLAVASAAGTARGLAVQARPGDTLVELSWSQPPGLHIRGYRVYRAGAKRPIHGERVLTSPHFRDIGLSNGRRYRYHITAVLEDGSDWQGYEPIEITCGRPSTTP